MIKQINLIWSYVLFVDIVLSVLMGPDVMDGCRMEQKSFESLVVERNIQPEKLVGGLSSLKLPFPLQPNERLCRGLTKLTLISSDKDFVLKLPCASYSPRVGQFIPLSSDHLEREINVYAAAVERGLNEILEPVTFIGSVNGVRGYTQRWVRLEEEPFRDSLLFNLSFLSESFYLKMVKWYGSLYTSRVIDFLAENGVTDFHPLNVGYRLGGQPCLFDYAGLIK